MAVRTSHQAGLGQTAPRIVELYRHLNIYFGRFGAFQPLLGQLSPAATAIGQCTGMVVTPQRLARPALQVNHRNQPLRGPALTMSSDFRKMNYYISYEHS